jgi:hypothetical protein
MRAPANGRPELSKRGKVWNVRAYNPAHHRVQSFKTRTLADAMIYLALCLRDWEAQNIHQL